MAHSPEPHNRSFGRADAEIASAQVRDAAFLRALLDFARTAPHDDAAFLPAFVAGLVSSAQDAGHAWANAAQACTAAGDPRAADAAEQAARYRTAVERFRLYGSVHA